MSCLDDFAHNPAHILACLYRLFVVLTNSQLMLLTTRRARPTATGLHEIHQSRAHNSQVTKRSTHNGLSIWFI